MDDILLVLLEKTQSGLDDLVFSLQEHEKYLLHRTKNAEYIE